MMSEMKWAMCRTSRTSSTPLSTKLVDNKELFDTAKARPMQNCIRRQVRQVGRLLFEPTLIETPIRLQE